LEDGAGYGFAGSGHEECLEDRLNQRTFLVPDRGQERALTEFSIFL
jgi:hypothetical protein